MLFHCVFIFTYIDMYMYPPQVGPGGLCTTPKEQNKLTRSGGASSRLDVATSFFSTYIRNTVLTNQHRKLLFSANHPHLFLGPFAHHWKGKNMIILADHFPHHERSPASREAARPTCASTTIHFSIVIAAKLLNTWLSGNLRWPPQFSLLPQEVRPYSHELK